MRRGVKFCGVTQESDIEKAVLAGAGGVGVIVRPDATLDRRSEGSRSISVERARELARKTPPNLEFVVAPRTADYDEIIGITDEIGPDRVQIAQVDDPEVVASLRNYFRRSPFVSLAKVIHVNEDTDPAVIDRFAPHVQFFQFDSGGPQPGGNGQPHDWEKSRELGDIAREYGRPVILGGGLTADNVAEAARIVRPAVIDVESANRQDGVYDLEMMRLFVHNAMGAMQA